MIKKQEITRPETPEDFFETGVGKFFRAQYPLMRDGKEEIVSGVLELISSDNKNCTLKNSQGEFIVSRGNIKMNYEEGAIDITQIPLIRY